jgi:uncharacterized protein YlxW (UPF0749 family)
MDRQVVALFIPILALAIPVVAVIFNGMLKMQKMKLEEARLRQAGDPGLLAEVEELRQDLHQVRTELSEVQERLDFAERLLTSKSQEGRSS